MSNGGSEINAAEWVQKEPDGSTEESGEHSQEPDCSEHGGSESKEDSRPN